MPLRFLEAEAVRTAVHWICLLLQHCWEGRDAWTPLAPASDYPPTFFPVATFGINHSTIFSLWDQPAPFFGLNSLLPINHELPGSSELFHPGGGLHQPCDQHASAGLPRLPLSLGFSFNRGDVALEGVSHLTPRIGRGESRGRGASLAKAKPARWPRRLPGRARNHLKMRGVKPRTLWKLPFTWRGD